MGAERFAGESAQNLEQKCLCVLVLDVSGSMRGEKLDSLNQGVRDFFTQIQTADGVPESLIDQLEIAIMQYDEEVRELPPTLTERGSMTETVVAIEEAIKLVEDRKAFYKSTGQAYYRPWIIVMTDGEPNGSKATQADIDAIAQRVAMEADPKTGKKYMIMGIGVGKDANMETLKKMTAGRAMALQGLKFGAFFEWLSASLSIVASSKEGDKIDISEGASNWMSSFEI